MSEQKEYYIVDAEAIRALMKVAESDIDLDMNRERFPNLGQQLETLRRQVSLQATAPDNAEIEDHFHFKERGMTGVKEMISGVPVSLEVGTLMMRNSITAASKYYDFLDQYFLDTNQSGVWHNPRALD